MANLLLNCTPEKVKEWLDEKPKFHYWAISSGIIWVSGVFISLYSLAAYEMSFTIPIIQTVLSIISAIWGILYFKAIDKDKSLILFLIDAEISIAGIIVFNL